MTKKTEQKITPREFDTYIAVIKNSVGSLMFKNLFVSVNGKKKDIVQDGWLSCAYYVSSILYLFKFIKGVHTTVTSTVEDLKKSGWKEIKKPVVGSIIVWEPGENTNGHMHIGFYIGKNKAISNDSWKKSPKEDNWKFDGKREVGVILWKPDIIIK